MKKNTEYLEPDSFYHIFNRGINGENLFKEAKNYRYFLEKYGKYIEPIADTYAFCLLKNHFHLLICTKSEIEIRKNINVVEEKEGFAQSASFLNQTLEFSTQLKHTDRPISWIISNNFSSLFKSYAQSINKGYNRTGSLFEDPFRRILVENDLYFTELIYYIHNNPTKHGFTNDFTKYSYSSYQSILSELPSKLKRKEVLDWFGNKEEFIKFHNQNDGLNYLDKFEIE